ncbi:MAG: ABC transporter permease [Candidatus Obscuribacter sp.]|nr:ABC transporter permease [Candidatus Obscuribacter sp.]MBK7839700.1 ABC transporter permease [Candidatus Obscuribacter sp.]MBK9202401.1 ABC transporter permease [Candidatus Obscuribacter sp.]MBK9618808.1 ABC transporter permease [Candidatus Obscuribacter sp.]MBL0184320.1 ABC transporter permease [Candidatus Obscuribacter sp.]
MAWQGILSNKLRSSLTVLGIVIGIASVITLLGIGQGAKVEAEKQVQALGVNLIYVRPGAANLSSVSQGQGSSATLTYDDAQAIKDNCPAVEDVAAQYNSGFQVQYGEQNTSTSVVATEPSYTEIRNFYPAKGRFFSLNDMKESTRVCVIGETVATNLFGEENPLRKQILIRGELFEIIGVMEHKGVTQMMDMDDQIFIPLTTGYATLVGLNTVTGRSVKSILVRGVEGEDMQAQFQITNLLRLRHNIQSPDSDDFTIRTQSDIMQTAQSITGVFSLLLGATAGISLLVGGIGIMNIMLVSVSERTKEIGIRKAIGAKYSQILSQFVIEAVLMSVTGGILGIALGVAGATALSQLAQWTTIVTPFSIALSFCVSLVIGLFFGIYPARQAAKLDPIVALRSE